MFILEQKYCFHCFLGLYWKQWRKSLEVSKMLHFFFKQGQIILSREILASSHSGLICLIPGWCISSSLLLSTSHPALPCDLSQESSFCPFLPPDVLLICLWFFTPPPTHVLLTYLWFGSEIDVGWNDTHFTAPENKAKNFWEKRRVHENESLVALQVSPESDSSGFICSRETLNHSSLAEKPPQSVFHS